MVTTARSHSAPQPAAPKRDEHASAHVDTFARDNLPARELWPEFIFTRPELQEMMARTVGLIASGRSEYYTIEATG